MKRFLLAAVAALCFASAANAAGLPANTFMATPAVTAGPTSTTSTMMGMGISNSFIPHYDGVAIITVTGTIANATASDGDTLALNYGTGTAPSAAGTLTGTACGAGIKILNNASTAAVPFPFTMTCIATGLALNLGYWIDIAGAQTTGGTGTFSNVTITAVEQ